MTYYIFAIKKEIYKQYRLRPDLLFKILYNLYKLNKNDLEYGVTIYHQICTTIDKSKLENYLKLINKTIKTQNKYIIKEENAIIIIKPSHILYKSLKITSNIAYILNSYYEYLLICDFKNYRCKWLNKQ